MKSRAVLLAAAIVAAFGLMGCESVSNTPDPLAASVIDEANMNELMLSAADPNDAVKYFQESSAREPNRADFRRGYALSLARAKRYAEAARVFQELITLGQEQPSDRLEYAMVAIHLEQWPDVETLAASFPDGLQTPRRYLVDAMLADHNSKWEEADAAYAKAEKLSSNPATILNNWGVSQMARGDLAAASKTFERAISFDSRLFSAKNNLAISRGLQHDYQVPLVPLTDEEKALVLNNLGIIAMRNGDEKIARGLFASAVEIHPQHYAAAADRLAALEANVQN